MILHKVYGFGLNIDNDNYSNTLIIIYYKFAFILSFIHFISCWERGPKIKTKKKTKKNTFNNVVFLNIILDTQKMSIKYVDYLCVFRMFEYDNKYTEVSELWCDHYRSQCILLPNIFHVCIWFRTSSYFFWIIKYIFYQYMLFLSMNEL